MPDAEQAIHAANRLRSEIPLLLALSVNSPFWQGRDTGLGSARTPLFQAFPRVGVPRAFHSYEEYVESVDVLIRSDAVPEPTFLWWDVRPQPRFGTVEVRIMDAQTTLADTAALAALVQSIVRLEIEEGAHTYDDGIPPEVLNENRFLAARDGMEAEADRRASAPLAGPDVLDSAASRLPPSMPDACLEELPLDADARGHAARPSDSVGLARGPTSLPGLLEALRCPVLERQDGAGVVRRRPGARSRVR